MFSIFNQTEKQFEYKGKSIDYLLFPASNSDYLVVVFSGFMNINHKEQKLYNYLNALADFEVNKLYIKDSYGSRGCYYMCEGLDFTIEEATWKLICEVQKALNIDNSKCFLVGSSKGGSVAMYYSAKYNCGCAIAGAPQVFLYDYLNGCAKETLDYMVGGNHTYGKRILNDLIPETILSSSNEVNILTSKNDYLYFSEILPLIEKCGNMRSNINISLTDKMKEHEEIGLVFPLFFQKIIFERIERTHISIIPEIQDHKIIVSTDYDSDKYEMECKFTLDNELFFVTNNEKNITRNILRRGKYKGRVLLTNKISQARFQFDLFPLMVDQEDVLTIFTTSDGESVRIILNNDDVITDYQYAFYLLNNQHEVIEKCWYSKQMIHEFRVDEPGVYSVQCFVKYQDKVDMYMSPIISVNNK